MSKLLSMLLARAMQIENRVFVFYLSNALRAQATKSTFRGRCPSPPCPQKQAQPSDCANVSNTRAGPGPVLSRKQHACGGLVEVMSDE